MKNERKMLSPVIEIVLGAALIIISKLFDLDSVWVGMGSALIAVGTVQFLNLLRYRQDADYREKVDTEAHDERNQFIRARAWVWAGTCFVLVGGVLTVLFQILGKQEYATLCGSGVSLLVLFYWISFLIVRKKY